eukprot:6345160-Pyramimonas_sp.AAC.1
MERQPITAKLTLSAPTPRSTLSTSRYEQGSLVCTRLSFASNTCCTKPPTLSRITRDTHRRYTSVTPPVD